MVKLSEAVAHGAARNRRIQREKWLKRIGYALLGVAAVGLIVGVGTFIKTSQNGYYYGEESYDYLPAEYGALFNKDTHELVKFTIDFDEEDLGPDQEYIALDVSGTGLVTSKPISSVDLSGEVTAYGNAYTRTMSVDFTESNPQAYVTLYNQLIAEGNSYDIGKDLNPLQVVKASIEARMSAANQSGLTVAPQFVLSGQESIDYDHAIAALYVAGVSAKDAQLTLPQGSEVIQEGQPVEYNFSCGVVDITVTNQEEVLASVSEQTGIPVDLLRITGTSGRIAVTTPEPCGYETYSLSSKSSPNGISSFDKVDTPTPPPTVYGSDW